MSTDLERAYAEAGRIFTEASKQYKTTCELTALVIEAHGADTPKDMLIEYQKKLKAARKTARKAEIAYFEAGSALYGANSK